MLLALPAIRLTWAWYRLQTHPSIETIEIAKPEIAEAIHALTQQISQTAQVPSPRLFIRRAALPNAFIIACIWKPDLYLTDELLEQCEQHHDPLAYLTFVLCHEIAHIQRGDAIQVGLLTYSHQWTELLKFKTISQHIEKNLAHIEQQTDALAEALMQRHLEDPETLHLALSDHA
ncbi:MAG: M48 family metalloprotease [Mariprofundaceae bacterium]|nr:M48 family metalloprotease [Mariprofundaceae bacterium]